MHRVLSCLAAVASVVSAAGAQTPPPASPEVSNTSRTDAAGAPAVTDKSGTDPTKFLRSLGIKNEYLSTTSSDFINTLTLTYNQPLANNVNARLKLPFVATDLGGDSEAGLGDISLRVNWLSYLDQKQGLLLGLETRLPTATDEVLGTEKWVVSPVATYALFVNRNIIFAPTYQHDFSIAGDGNRADVNQSVLDFYLVYTNNDKTRFLTLDPQLYIDWENDTVPFVLKTMYGQRVGNLWGGAVNFSVQGALGIGDDRPYDWGVEVGISIVGF